MRVAYVDMVGGAAGDMLLAALLDAGAPEPELRAGLARLPLSGWKLEVSQRDEGALRARRVEVPLEPAPQPHRHLSDVLDIIAAARLPVRAEERARRVFTALAVAEGKVHGVSPDEVHFHEVGAVDAIVDVVGVCLALELLGVDRLEASPFPLGRGFVRAEHGLLPLPAPAVLHLIEAVEAPVVGREQERELVTPTGAALICALAESFGPYPSLELEKVGYGAGRRQAGASEPPNLVRVVVGQAIAPAAGSPGEVVVLEANLDDQSPELTGYLVERLLEGGALDVFLTPIQMKKGRPGVTVTALVAPDGAGLAEDALLRESSTLGVRRRVERRLVLPREWERVATPWGEVRVKLARRPDGRVSRAPEYEDCAKLARAARVPLWAVYAAAREPAGRHG